MGTNDGMGRLSEAFALAQRQAQVELAVEMGMPPNFFDTDPAALDKLVAFMTEKKVILGAPARNQSKVPVMKP